MTTQMCALSPVFFRHGERLIENMSIIDITIMCLATWRIAHLLAKEDGPYDIVARFRHLLGVRYDEHSVAYGTTMLSKMIICVWCNSVWVGTAVTAIYLLSPAWLLYALLAPFALSAVAVIIEHCVVTGG